MYVFFLTDIFNENRYQNDDHSLLHDHSLPHDHSLQNEEEELSESRIVTRHESDSDSSNISPGSGKYHKMPFLD